MLFRVDLQFLLSHNRLSGCICLICQGNLNLYSNQISREKMAEWSDFEKLDHYVNLSRRGRMKQSLSAFQKVPDVIQIQEKAGLIFISA